MDDLKESLDEIFRMFYIFCSIRGKSYRNDQNNFLYKYRVFLDNLEEKNSYYPLFINAINLACEWNDDINDLKKPKIKEEYNDSLTKLFELVEKYIVRLLVTKGTGQSLTIFFENFIERDINISCEKLYKTLKDTPPDNGNQFLPFKDFMNELKSNNLFKHELQVKKMFRKISNHYTGRNYFDTLEHIMPQDNAPWKKDFKEKHHTRRRFSI